MSSIVFPSRSLETTKHKSASPMKSVLILLGLYTAALTTHAQFIVKDPWVEAQQLIELIRRGDPALIRRLAGFDHLSKSLGDQGVGITLQEIQEVASGLNALYYDGRGLYRVVEEVIATSDGAIQPRKEQDFRKFDAVAAASQNYQAVHEDTEARRRELRQQLRATTAKVQSATTEVETEKLKAVIAAQAADLASIDREREAAATRVLVQDIENRNDKARQEQARAEDHGAAFQKAGENLARFLKPSTAPVLIPAPRSRR